MKYLPEIWKRQKVNIYKVPKTWQAVGCDMATRNIADEAHTICNSEIMIEYKLRHPQFHSLKQSHQSEKIFILSIFEFAVEKINNK